MAIKDDPILTVDDVFLQMVGRIQRVEDAHMALAGRTTMRCLHVDSPIILAGCGAEPTWMADRRASFLGFVRSRRVGRLFGCLVCCVFLGRQNNNFRI